MTDAVAVAAVALSAAAVAYTYIGYPLLLLAFTRARGHGGRPPAPDHTGRIDWPKVSISVPVHNEERQVQELIECLLALDYPKDRLQILFVSDACSDRTDEIISRFADQGVELLRLAERGGKTKAENAAVGRLSGEIVLNMDASVRVRPQSVKALVAAFDDPTVGCASGRDVAVVGMAGFEDVVELGYVGYEMSVRDLETVAGSIVGASGCFYAVRKTLHQIPLPDDLDRDFAAALHAVERGYRAVSVSEAVCTIQIARSIRDEYRRKVRTMSRGMRTLWLKRELLNPLRHGLFSWMLVSHKVLRWATPWLAGTALVALPFLAPGASWARVLIAGVALWFGLAALGWWYFRRTSPPRLVAVPTAVVAANVAAMHALIRALRGAEHTFWSPTERDSAV